MMKPQQQDHGVEVIRPFLFFAPGFVMYPPALYREQLIKGRWVKPLTGPKSLDEDKPSLDALRQRKQPRLTRG